MNQQSTQNRARRLTGDAPAAVAVIQADALPIEIERFFEPAVPRALQDVPAERILFGRWRGEDVLLVRIRETRWEVHCHGGKAAVDRILADLHDSRCRVPESRADHPVDSLPVPAESLEEHLLQSLMHLRTPEPVRRILRHIPQLQSQLTEILDDPRSAVNRGIIQDILACRSFTERLLRPTRIVIAGAPNSGKSSLLNDLLGYDRALVSEVAGTTRDSVEQPAVIAGRPVLFCDTAGIRDKAADEIEQAGIQRSAARIEAADLLFPTLDAASLQDGQLPADTLQLLVSLLRTEKVPVILLTRADLVDEPQQIAEICIDTLRSQGFSPPSVLPISVRSSVGMTILRDILSERVIAVTDTPSSFVPCTPELAEIVTALKEPIAPVRLKVLRQWVLGDQRTR